jgi:hypothetical protein
VTEPAPSGVAAVVSGDVVARRRGTWNGAVVDGTVTIPDERSGLLVGVPVESSTSTSTMTTAWLSGHRVVVLEGTTTPWLLAGRVSRAGGAPFGVTRVEDDGSFELAVDDLDQVAGLRSTVDTLVPSVATAGGMGASVLSDGASRELSSLEAVPSSGDPRRGVFQPCEGEVVSVDGPEGRRWLHGTAQLAGDEIEVLAQRGDESWAAARTSGRLSGRARTAGPSLRGDGPAYVGWTATGGLQITAVFRRDWYPSDGLPLLQGEYVLVDGLWRSAEPWRTAGRGADGQPMMQPGRTVVTASSPVLPDRADYVWTAVAGARTVPDDEVEARVRVRTAATVAGMSVELARPWDPFTSHDVLEVRGAGVVPEAVLLSDGYLVEPEPAGGAGWVARVRQDHLEDVRTDVLER